MNTDGTDAGGSGAPGAPPLADRRDPETYAILGAAMEVHGELGAGFLEAVYQEALAVELSIRNIPFERECLVPVTYKGERLACGYRADFVCFDDVLVELKALTRLTVIEQAQILNYLKATGKKRGLLLNFGSSRLEYRRLVKLIPSVSSVFICGFFLRSRIRGEAMELSDRVAVITGAGSGIGRATALRLAREGASIVVADMNEDGARETVALIEQAGGQATAARVDVTKSSDLRRMFDVAAETYGGFDVLYNNAGVTTGQPRYPESSEEQWRRTIEVDLNAVIEGTRQAISRLKDRGGGVIINTASLAGLFGFQADPVYAAAKHGVVGLTRALVNLLPEANIRVNCVCPAVVKTPLVVGSIERLSGEERTQAEQRLSAMPMLPPEEIAEAVYELIRDDTATGIVMGITLGDPRRVVDPPITLPVTSGDPAGGPQRR